MRGKDRKDAPRAQQREATRAALLAAAFALAQRPEADPLDPASVASEAGVSRPLFYRYFRNPAEYVDALLASLHAPGGELAAEAANGSVAEALVAFFVKLAAPLDRHPDLAKALIPRSHLPGPVAFARTRRRETAIGRIEALLPAGLEGRRERAAFLMDAYLGVQLAWSKGQGTASEGLADRVRRDLRWAVAGVLPNGTKPS